jgi:hypothetical protein
VALVVTDPLSFETEGRRHPVGHSGNVGGRRPAANKAPVFSRNLHRGWEHFRPR